MRSDRVLGLLQDKTPRVSWLLVQGVTILRVKVVARDPSHQIFERKTGSGDIKTEAVCLDCVGENDDGNY